MNERFDEHRARLTKAEDERVWKNVRERTVGGKRRWLLGRLPMSLVGAAAAVAIVVVVVSRDGGPETMLADFETKAPVEEQAAGSLAEKAPGTDREPVAGEKSPALEEGLADDTGAASDASIRPGALGSVDGPGTKDESASRAEEREARAEPPAARTAQEEIAVTARRQSSVPRAEPRGAAPAASPAPGSAMELLSHFYPDEPLSDATLTVVSDSVRVATARRDRGATILRGVVRDSAGAPLAHANVSVVGAHSGAISRDDGTFEVRLGERRNPTPLGLRVSYIGHESATVDTLGIDVWGELVAIEVALRPQPVVLAAVEVSGARQQQLDTRSAERIEDAIALKGGVIARPDELYFRNRTQAEGKARADLPAAAPASGGAAREEQEAVERSWGEIRPFFDTRPPADPDEQDTEKDIVRRPRRIDAMFFQHYGVNPFVATTEDALATFAVDVDAASYAIARSYLNRGAMPPAAAIRVEEFVNAFRHDYAPPRGDDVAGVDPALTHEGTFAIHLDAAPSPLHEDVVLFRVGLKGREVEAIDRKPLNLTFVIDVSGSMKRGNRLELVKRSLIELLYQLNEHDQVAIVAYSTTAEVVSPPTSLRNRWALEQLIENLRPLHSTNAEAGLRLGYTLAEQAYDDEEENRVVLCSDGVANVGETGPEGILAEIHRAAGRGIYMTAIGVGMGNYNDVLLEQIANKGDGSYYYVDTPAEAKRVLVDGFTGTFQTIARDAKIQVEFDPEIVTSYRLLGYENRDVADADFRNNTVDAGEVGAGHEVTALFELELARDVSRNATVAVTRIRFEDPDTGVVTEDYDTLRGRDVQRSFSRMPVSFRLDAAVAGFAEILRDSYWAREDTFGAIVEIARDVAVDTRGREDVAELITLVHAAERIAERDRAAGWRTREREWLEGE